MLGRPVPGQLPHVGNRDWIQPSASCLQRLGGVDDGLLEIKAVLEVRIVLKNGAKSECVVEVLCENAVFPHEIWSRLGDLNPGPTHYECVQYLTAGRNLLQL